jgi:hypothetical protein
MPAKKGRRPGCDCHSTIVGRGASPSYKTPMKFVR